MEEGLPEVTLHDIAHEPGELHGQRLVEAHGLTQDRAVGLRRLRHHEGDRIAAHLEDGEGHERHAREHHQEANDPAHDETQHGLGRRVPLPSYLAGLASKSQSHSSPRAAYCTFFEMASVSYWVHRKMAGASSRIICWIWE